MNLKEVRRAKDKLVKELMGDKSNVVTVEITKIRGRWAFGVGLKKPGKVSLTVGNLPVVIEVVGELVAL